MFVANKKIKKQRKVRVSELVFYDRDSEQNFDKKPYSVLTLT